MDMRIPPLRIKIMFESNPLKSTMLVGRLGVWFVLIALCAAKLWDSGPSLRRISSPYVYIYIYIYIYTYTYTHTYTYTFIYIYIEREMCIYIYIYIYHVCIHIYIYIYTHICISFIYVCVDLLRALLEENLVAVGEAYSIVCVIMLYYTV